MRPAPVRDNPMKKTLFTFLAAVLLLAPKAPVHAHADLVETDPKNSQTLETAPEHITLTFNEDVTLLESTELRSETTVAYDASVNANVVTINPRDPLRNGTWTLAWRIVSADGHPVGGTLRFNIGEPGAHVNGATTTTRHKEPILLDRVLEALTWLGLATGAGLLLAGKRRRSTGPLAIGGAAALLRVLDASERYGGAVLDIGETRSAIVAVAAAACMLALGNSSRAATHTGLLIFAAGATQSGHHARLDSAAYTLLHAGHVYLGLLWAAGVTAVLADPANAERTSRTITRAVLLLVPVGTLYGAAMLGDGYQTWETILTVKLVLVACALGLGAISHFALKRQKVSGLRRRTLLEATLLIAVAASTAALTASTPSKFETATGVTTVTEEDAGAKTRTTETSGEITFEDGSTLPVHAIWDSDTGQLTMHVTTDGTFEQAEFAIMNEAGETSANGTFTTGQVLSATVELPGKGTWTLQVTVTSGFATTVGETTLDLP